MIFDTRKNLVDIFKVLLKVVSGCVCYSWIFEGYPGFATSAGQHDALRTADCRHPWHAWVRRNCSGGQHFRIIGMVDICWYPKSSKSWMTMTWYSTSVMVTGDFPWLKNPPKKVECEEKCSRSHVMFLSLRAQGLLENLPFIDKHQPVHYPHTISHEFIIIKSRRHVILNDIPMIFHHDPHDFPLKNHEKNTVFWVLSVSIQQHPAKCRGLTCLWSRNPWLAVEVQLCGIICFWYSEHERYTPKWVCLKIGYP